MGAVDYNFNKLLERIRRNKFEPRAIWVVAGAGRVKNKHNCKYIIIFLSLERRANIFHKWLNDRIVPFDRMMTKSSRDNFSSFTVTRLRGEEETLWYNSGLLMPVDFEATLNFSDSLYGNSQAYGKYIDEKFNATATIDSASAVGKK